MQMHASFECFKERCHLDRDAVINHVVEKFFPDYKERRKKTAHNNLSIIFDATFKLSAVMGFAKMTVRDLQKETDISMGGLYNYFSSKDILERMIVEGLLFVTESMTLPLENSDKPSDVLLEKYIKGYIYLSEVFRPWYYFVFMEVRTMAPESTKLVQEIQGKYLERLSPHLNDSLILASDLCVIVQDFYLKSWKYENVLIDDFANHCFALAQVMRSHSERLGHLKLSYGNALG